MKRLAFVALLGASAALAEENCLKEPIPDIPIEGIEAIAAFPDCIIEFQSVKVCTERLRLTTKELKVFVCIFSEVDKRMKDTDKRNND